MLKTKNFSILSNSTNDHRTLIGSLLIYFTLGSLLCYGSIFIYIASYFKNFESISLKSSNVVAFIAIPSGFCSVFSLKISKKIGFLRMVRIFPTTFALFVFISSYVKSYSLFILFFIVINAITNFGLIYLPILDNVWKIYSHKKGTISGFMFAIIGISQLFFTFFTSFIVNPKNLRADIAVQEESNTVFYFGKEVSMRVPMMIRFESFIIFLCGIIGGFLIREFKDVNEDNTINNSLDVELSDEKTDSDITDKISSNYNELKTNFNTIISETESFTKECPNIKQGIFSQPFFLIFLISFLLSNFSLFLAMNLRAYCLTKINDDYFVTLISLINAIGSAFGRIFWGWIFDRTSFDKLYMFLVFSNFWATFIFVFISSFKYFLAFEIFIINFFDGGIMCIIGPGMITIFGKKIGSSLYPIKVFAFYVALLITPILSYFLLFLLKMDTILIIFSIFNLIATILVFFIKYDYSWKIK